MTPNSSGSCNSRENVVYLQVSCSRGVSPPHGVQAVNPVANPMRKDPAMGEATHDRCPACGSRLTRIHCGVVICRWSVCEACCAQWDERHPERWVQLPDRRRRTA